MSQNEQPKYIDIFIEDVAETCKKYNFDIENPANRAFLLKITEHAMRLTAQNSPEDAMGNILYDYSLSELINKFL